MTEQERTPDHQDEDDVAPPLTISQHYENFILQLRGVNPWWVVLAIVMVPLIFQTAGTKLYESYPSIGIPPFVGPKVGALSTELIWVTLSVVVSPFIETLIFQRWAPVLVRRYLKLNRLNTVLLLSLAFCLAHLTQPIARLSIFACGFLLTSFYYSRSVDGGRPLMWVAGTHMLANLVVVVLFKSNLI